MILIVDFGSQTAHLIGRRLRQLGITTEYTNPDEALELIKGFKGDKRDKGENSEKASGSSVSSDTSINGIILSGGPASVFEKGAPTIEKKIFELGIPVLGICYGWQLMAQLLGAKVEEATKEYGP